MPFYLIAYVEDRGFGFTEIMNGRKITMTYRWNENEIARR